MSPNEIMDNVVSSEAVTESADKKKSSMRVFYLGIIVALFAVFLGLGGWAMYGVYQGSEHVAVLALASAFRMPVAKVNGEPILYTDYINDIRSLRTFYEKQGDAGAVYDDVQQSDQVLSRLIANTLVASVAREMNVTITDEDRENAKKDILLRFDNDEAKFAADVSENLGITTEDFFARVLEPTILEKKTAEKFGENTDPTLSAYTEKQVRARHILFPVTDTMSDAKAKAEANRVLKLLQKGASFAEMAKKYGSDGTKDLGGDLGWFGMGDMVKEFEDAAFALEKDRLVDEPVKTQFGYHIIFVEDRRTSKNFSAYMNEKLKTSKIEIFGKIHNPFENLQGGASVTAQ